MRQVPYTLIGNGRLAMHLCYYFQQLNIPFQHWYRQSQTELADVVASSSRVLLLISDDAIETFIHEHPYLQEKFLIHCSGQLVTPLAHGAHPLMSFGAQHYTLNEYQIIPFILEQEGPDFNDLLPGLPNPHYKIANKLKPRYHTLCVLANNFTTLLWQKFFKGLETDLHLPQSIGKPYLAQTLKNLLNDPANALTGPLKRQDQLTLEKNLAALANDPYQQVYQAFINAYNNTLNIKETIV
ncbi:MAG: DUF2520 domain-containing protein [Gammaproteobacteria bacterium]|nr:DUF2520 domain-containing protein [Gammaproteobacteria bacterium]